MQAGLVYYCEDYGVKTQASNQGLGIGEHEQRGGYR